MTSPPVNLFLQIQSLYIHTLGARVVRSVELRSNAAETKYSVHYICNLFYIVPKYSGYVSVRRQLKNFYLHWEQSINCNCDWCLRNHSKCAQRGCTSLLYINDLIVQSPNDIVSQNYFFFLILYGTLRNAFLFERWLSITTLSTYRILQNSYWSGHLKARLPRYSSSTPCCSLRYLHDLICVSWFGIERAYCFL